MAVDIILLLFMTVFVLSYYRKGFIISLCSVLVLVLSCMGAGAAQKLLTPTMTEWLQPKLESGIYSMLEEGIADSASDAVDSAAETTFTVAGQEMDLTGLLELLETFGIDVEQTATDTAVSATQPAAESISAAAAAGLAPKIASFAVFVLAFLLIYFILQIVMLALNLADRLPVVHTLNHVGGGIVGFIAGAFILTVVTAVLQKAGILSESLLQGPVCVLLRMVAARLF